MSGDQQRRRGSRYLNGGDNKLMRMPTEPDDRFGPYTPEQLIKMDKKFTARLNRAFAKGRENRMSASASVRPGAGDRDKLLLAG
jgi:hypothetical protein